MPNVITMRELQKMSAGAIGALPHATPIKSGNDTVAVLVPMHRVSPEFLADVLARIDAAAAARTPEQNALIDEILGDREID
jgi:hypothetical protein